MCLNVTDWWELQEKVLEALADWQADPATSSNVTVLLVAALVQTNEGNYVEALRAVHGAQNLEMCVCCRPNTLSSVPLLNPNPCSETGAPA